MKWIDPEKRYPDEARLILTLTYNDSGYPTYDIKEWKDHRDLHKSFEFDYYIQIDEIKNEMDIS